jgi:hypothetical protein
LEEGGLEEGEEEEEEEGEGQAEEVFFDHSNYWVLSKKI